MATVPESSLVLTREAIEASDDDHVEGLLLEYVLGLQTRAPDRLDTLPLACQAHFIAFILDGEVLNGGFNQFWFNSPEFAADAAQALEFLELPEAAELARRASKIYEGLEHKHREARQAGTIEAFMATYEGTPFQEVDDAYSAREAEWREARIRFIRENIDQFVHPSAD